MYADICRQDIGMFRMWVFVNFFKQLWKIYHLSHADMHKQNTPKILTNDYRLFGLDESIAFKI